VSGPGDRRIGYVERLALELQPVPFSEDKHFGERYIQLRGRGSRMSRTDRAACAE
jgi:hypothetical protein